MISREKTIREKGYDPEALSPKSNKKVWAICNECGKGRWVHRRAYRDLCHSCAIKQMDLSGEKNPMYGRKHSQTTKDKIRDAMSGEKNPNYGKHLSKELRSKLSKLKRGKNNPFYGKKHSEQQKKKIGDAVRRERNYWFGKKLPEDVRKKMSKNHAEVNGANNPNWKGGSSFAPYCEKFNKDLKERVRNFFDRRCYICGKTEEENTKRLDVHHVNYDKMACCNDTIPLFVPLCMKCHRKISGDRKGWEEFFTISLNYLTKGKCFEPKGVNSYE